MPDRADFKPERADFRPEMADFRPEIVWGTYERKIMNKQMNKWTNKCPPVFYKTLSPLWPLPKKQQ